MLGSFIVSKCFVIQVPILDLTRWILFLLLFAFKSIDTLYITFLVLVALSTDLQAFLPAVSDLVWCGCNLPCLTYHCHVWMYSDLMYNSIFNSKQWRVKRDLLHIHTVHKQEMPHRQWHLKAESLMCLELWQFKQNCCSEIDGTCFSYLYV